MLPVKHTVIYMVFAVTSVQNTCFCSVFNVLASQNLQNNLLFTMFFSCLAVVPLPESYQNDPKFHFNTLLRSDTQKSSKNDENTTEFWSRCETVFAPPAKPDIATAILTNVIEHLVLLFCPPISTPSPPKRCGRIFYACGCLPTLVPDWIPTGSRLDPDWPKAVPKNAKIGARRDPDEIPTGSIDRQEPTPAPIFPFPDPPLPTFYFSAHQPYPPLLHQNGKSSLKPNGGSTSYVYFCVLFCWEVLSSSYPHCVLFASPYQPPLQGAATYATASSGSCDGLQNCWQSAKLRDPAWGSHPKIYIMFLR